MIVYEFLRIEWAFGAAIDVAAIHSEIKNVFPALLVCGAISLRGEVEKQ